MLLKKIFYGYTRVRYVICEQEEDGGVTMTFCRWRPLGPKAGKGFSSQYFSNSYWRENPYKTLTNLSYASDRKVVRFRYDGTWVVTFYQKEIRSILFSNLLDTFVWLYLLFVIVMNIWK